MRDFLGWQGPEDDSELALAERVAPGKVALTSRLVAHDVPRAEADPHPLTASLSSVIGMGNLPGEGEHRPRRRGGGHAHADDAAVSPDQITVRTAAPAPGGQGFARTTVGVGEHMTFTAPARASGTWTASGGSPATGSGPTLAWVAPATPGSITINFAGTPNASLTMTVIAPNAVEMQNIGDLAGMYAPGTAGAGMNLRIGIQPWTVSFGGIFIREIGDGEHGAARGVQGYFERFAASELRHAPTAAWADITDSSFTDTARDQGDTAASRPGRYPQPWRAGTYHWMIPYHYRVQGTGGDGVQFATVRQSFTMADDGTVTVTKGAESVSRSPGGAAAQAPQPAAQAGAQPAAHPPVQRMERGAALDDPFAVHQAAARGVSGAAQPLPHHDAIQRSFGHHDVSGVRAHVGGPASDAAYSIGASAYATGDDVAFAASPDLRQAAHETAHVVQQRGGVRLDGGVGRSGDVYERHADAVADKVVRGESAEALLDTMAHRGSAGGPAVQRLDLNGDGIDDDHPMVEYTFIPREVPSPAGRALQATLMRGIPAANRHDEGQVLLALLPGLANILDPDRTAAADRDLITNSSSAWHPASYAGDAIPTPYSWALWDYYKARWESPDRATRNGHLDLALSHWHSLMLPRTFNTFVASAERAAIRAMVTDLIEGAARHVRSSRTYDVLSRNGVPLTADEIAARAAAAATAPTSRRSGGGGGGAARSATVDVAPGDVHVTDGEARTVRYINPAAIRFVPHVTSGGPDPRRTTFNPLADLLNERVAAAADPTALAAVDARITAAEAPTRERMRVYVRAHRRGDERDAALAEIDTVPLTTDVVVQAHDVDVGLFRVHLEPVAPGSLIERPGGYRATTTEISTGRSVTGRPTEEIMNEVVSGLSGDQQTIARQYMEVIRRAEGSMTSLNTWDRLRITLGSGVGAAGRLQDRFAAFDAEDHEAYTRLFGRHDIGVEAHGFDSHGHGSGNSVFTTHADDGSELRGTDATEEMANDPATLGVMVAAGFDPAWQRFLLRGGVESLTRAFEAGFARNEAGEYTVRQSGGTNLYAWLSGHVSANVLAASMFAIADDYHGSGHIAAGTRDGFNAVYAAAAAANPFDVATPSAAPDGARLHVATWLVVERSHQNRRTHIAAALGVGSYGAITGG